MPHQCTDCGRTFADGSKEMLSGCPDCGGNKFEFRPDGVDDEAEAGPPADSGSDPPAEPPEPPEPAVDSSVARTVGKAANTVKGLVGSEDGPTRGAPEPDTAESPATDAGPPPSSPAETGPSVEAGTEDSAQASARSELVSPDDLPPATDQPLTAEESAAREPFGASSTAAEESAAADGSPQPDERPDLSDLREELNEQFESIKVLEPGQYELNLMELYDREEYIIALQEDGKYTIQVPERYGDA